uniref:Cytochrome P450 n=1 Tax=Anopheles dirus TaxID=7168 RepID=A0A182NMT1_9DIPT
MSRVEIFGTIKNMFLQYSGWFKISIGPTLVLCSSHPDIMNAVLSHPECLDKPFLYDFLRLESSLEDATQGAKPQF